MPVGGHILKPMLSTYMHAPYDGAHMYAHVYMRVHACARACGRPRTQTGARRWFSLSGEDRLLFDMLVWVLTLSQFSFALLVPRVDLESTESSRFLFM